MQCDVIYTALYLNLYKLFPLCTYNISFIRCQSHLNHFISIDFYVLGVCDHFMSVHQLHELQFHYSRKFFFFFAFLAKLQEQVYVSIYYLYIALAEVYFYKLSKVNPIYIIESVIKYWNSEICIVGEETTHIMS